MSYYSTEELQILGLARFGEDVLISKIASIYNPGGIAIGSHVRIDDFCVLSAGQGGIEIGDYVHVAVFCSLIGSGKITLSDFCNLSSRVSVYSSNDDYSGMHMTNPMVPKKYTGVEHAAVSIGKHAIVGAGAVILPGVRLDEGAAIGALSLVKDSCSAFSLWSGVPARRIGTRKRDLLELEKRLRMEATRNIDK